MILRRFLPNVKILGQLGISETVFKIIIWDTLWDWESMSYVFVSHFWELNPSRGNENQYFSKSICMSLNDDSYKILAKFEVSR